MEHSFDYSRTNIALAFAAMAMTLAPACSSGQPRGFISGGGSATASSAADDVRLEPGIVGATCTFGAKNVNIRNKNSSRSVRATVGYRNGNGAEGSIVVTLRPGELKQSILYCAFDKAWIAGAEYV